VAQTSQGQDRHAAAHIEASDLNWQVGNLAQRTPGGVHAMVVAADGLPVAVSDRLDQLKAEQLAAIALGWPA
jgi:predicted regulator of Ras-like GTPase activity (Roadblock/LC7/MglB family)